jgi:hypothetical protein
METKASQRANIILIAEEGKPSMGEKDFGVVLA